MDPDAYDGPERRQSDRRHAEASLAEVAAYVRANEEIDRKLHETLWKAAAGALIAALLVGIGVGLVVGNYFGDNARHNAAANCDIQAKGVLRGNGRAFAQRQILHVADEAFQQFPARFRNVELARINRELNAVRDRLAPGAPDIVDEFDDLNVLLPIQPRLDCGGLIR